MAKKIKKDFYINVQGDEPICNPSDIIKLIDNAKKFPNEIINGYTENKFINQLKLSSPNIILYKSPYNILTNYSNMPNALKYIEKEYSFFENFNNYIFYKKN